ncbi:AFG1-like ATPase [Ascodesmis nigricans]|uniref:AFG1-like ATPase n=1 Tax=Ascodesmis nigricans TaxID=341454 RepID=A0A4S2N0R0_9PEZI|nr:AFG1-like ATPase [Ascodesmis nigricans]
MVLTHARARVLLRLRASAAPCNGTVARTFATTTTSTARAPLRAVRARGPAGGVQQRRWEKRWESTAAATVTEGVKEATTEAQESLEQRDDRAYNITNTFPRIGPLEQYDRWVGEGKLRDDEYQRGIVKSLQKLHDDLTDYEPPTVVHPTEESLKPPPEPTFFQKLLGKEPPPIPKTEIPENMPAGMYLYGDVGSGKTMLMDMFYSTLPNHITSKTRIHFHHFMQDVHKRLHRMKVERGPDFDAVPYVAADIAESSAILCFDEFQCTDVADAMILRRLLTHLMEHGVVMIATSNRHPDELYKNGIQRASFIPCIELLKTRLTVINLDSPTDYRKVERPQSSVYHFPLDAKAAQHAEKWFRYFGDEKDPAGPRAHTIWGRDVRVPKASGKAAMFAFNELCGSAMSAADYLELCRHYNAFVVTEVPGMDHKSRDLARRFITFLDAAYESRAKLVLTCETPLQQLFVSKDEIRDSIDEKEGGDLDSSFRSLMDDLGMDMKMLKNSSIFTGDEERFAFARALSRLTEMGSVQWVEREV